MTLLKEEDYHSIYKYNYRPGSTIKARENLYERDENILKAIQTNNLEELTDLNLTHQEIDTLFSIYDYRKPPKFQRTFPNQLFWDMLLNTDQSILDHIYSVYTSKSTAPDPFAAIMFNQSFHTIQQTLNHSTQPLPVDVLYAAIARRNIQALQYFRDEAVRFVDQSKSNSLGQTDDGKLSSLFFVNLYDKDHKTLEYLIEIDHTYRAELRKTIFFLAVSTGQVELVQKMLDKEMVEQDIQDDETSLFPKTPLYVAIEKGQLEVVKTLIGKEFVTWPRKAVSHLGLAALNGHLSVCEYLVESPFGKNGLAFPKDDDVLYRLVKNNQHEVLQFLAEKFPGVVAQLKQSNLLEEAFNEENFETFQCLAKLRLKMDSQNSLGGTLLHKAAAQGRQNIVEVYKEYCPDAFAMKNKNGFMPFSCVSPEKKTLLEYFYEIHQENQFADVDPAHQFELVVRLDKIDDVKIAIESQDSSTLKSVVSEAIFSNSPQSLECLLSKILPKWDSNDKLKKHGSPQAYLGSLIEHNWQILFEKNQQETLHILMKFCREYKVDTKKYLKKSGHQIILNAAYNNNEKLIEELLEHWPDVNIKAIIANSKATCSQEDTKKALQVIATVRLTLYIANLQKENPNSRSRSIFKPTYLVSAQLEAAQKLLLAVGEGRDLSAFIPTLEQKGPLAEIYSEMKGLEMIRPPRSQRPLDVSESNEPSLGSARAASDPFVVEDSNHEDGNDGEGIEMNPRH